MPPPNLAEGAELPGLAIKPGLGQVIRACALGWFFPPIFYDTAAARAQGMPGTLVPGPFKLGLLYRAVDDWLDGAGWVRQVRAAHRRPDITGHELRVVGHVARVFEAAGKRCADIELTIVNDRGEPSVRGFASVELYS